MNSPLSNPRFARLFTAQIIALVGAGFTTVALTLLAWDMAGGSAGALLGTVLAIKMVAYVFFAPVIGGIAHRFNRKFLMILMDLLRAGIVVAMLFVSAVWQIYVLTFLLSVFSAGFKPVFQSTIPDILPDEQQYTVALSYSRLAYDLETLASPMLAGVLLLVMSYDALFVINGLAFLMSALLIWITVVPLRERIDRMGSVVNEITFGVRAYLKTPRLKGMLMFYVGVASASAMVIVNTVVYVRESLGGSEAQVAAALAASGAGSMLAATQLPRWLESIADRSVMPAGTVMMALGLVVMSVGPDFVQLLSIWFVIGFGWSLVQTPAGRVVNRSSAVKDRDSYFSAQFALSHACWLLMYPVAGQMGQAIGIETTALVLGFVVVGFAVLGTFLWPRHDPLVIEHTHNSITHTHEHTDDDHHVHSHERVDSHEPVDSDERAGEQTGGFEAAHRHEHAHEAVTHSHVFVIDDHHPVWPRPD